MFSLIKICLVLIFSIISNSQIVRYCFAPCTDEFNPVCGKTCTTYQNMCKLICESSDELLFEYACPKNCKAIQHQPPGRPIKKKNCICTTEYDPVCAAGTTYGNACTARCYFVFFFTKGECPQ